MKLNPYVEVNSKLVKKYPSVKDKNSKASGRDQNYQSRSGLNDFELARNPYVSQSPQPQIKNKLESNSEKERYLMIYG
jgi:hypothetical protein